MAIGEALMAAGLQKFKAAVEMLSKDVYNELPIQQILIFIHVSINEGTSMKDLRKIFNMSQSSISRNVSMLGIRYQETPRHLLGLKLEPKGHGLIEARRDLYNPRLVALFLTDRGKEIRDKIESLM